MYYHVSSFLEVNQIITRKTKNNIDFCSLASACDISTFDKFIILYEKLCFSEVHKKTGRTAEKWLCEYIFEKVRMQKFPNYPSRIWGLYLNTSVQEAKDFLIKYRDVNTAKIFELELSDEITVYCFNMDIFTEAHELLLYNTINESIYQRVNDLANEYWKSYNNYQGTKEFLIDNYTIKVGHQIGLEDVL